jgi:hypothetical protein
MSFEGQHDSLLKNHSDAAQEIKIIHTTLIKIRQLVQMSPQINGNGSAWRYLADRAEAERSVVHKLLDGKALFTGLMQLYAGIYREMTCPSKDMHLAPLDFTDSELHL